MGGCAGKTKSKKAKSYGAESDSTKKPKSRTKPSPSENLPSSNGSTVNNDKQIANTEENGIEPDVQDMIERYDEVNKVIGQIFSSLVVSISDSELEYELANLIYGHPENDYAENPIVATTYKSTEV